MIVNERKSPYTTKISQFSYQPYDDRVSSWKTDGITVVTDRILRVIQVTNTSQDSCLYRLEDNGQTQNIKKVMYFTPKPSKTCHFLWWNGHNPACILLSPMKMKIFIKIIECFWFFTNFMDQFDENLHFHRWKQNMCMILSVPRKKGHFFDVLCPWADPKQIGRFENVHPFVQIKDEKNSYPLFAN